MWWGHWVVWGCLPIGRIVHLTLLLTNLIAVQSLGRLIERNEPSGIRNSTLRYFMRHQRVILVLHLQAVARQFDNFFSVFCGALCLFWAILSFEAFFGEPTVWLQKAKEISTNLVLRVVCIVVSFFRLLCYFLLILRGAHLIKAFIILKIHIRLQLIFNADVLVGKSSQRIDSFCVKRQFFWEAGFLKMKSTALI